MSGSNCCFLTCIQIFQEAGKVVWYSHLFKNFSQFVVIYTVKGFGVINKVDVYLEFSCFFYDPKDVGNLISGSSAFSKSSLNLIITVRQVSWSPICYTYTLSYVGNTCSWWVYKLVQLLRRVIWRQLCKLKGVSWAAKRSNQSILREINPEYLLEGLMLKMKLQYFGHLMRTADSLEKSLMLGKIESRRRGRQRMRWLNGIINAMHMNLGKLREMVRDRGLTCYSSWGGKESDTTGWLNNNMQTTLGPSNFTSESISSDILHSAQRQGMLTLKSL